VTLCGDTVGVWSLCDLLLIVCSAGDENTCEEAEALVYYHSSIASTCMPAL